MGMPQHLTVSMHNLYSWQEATVSTECGEMKWFPVGRGVRKGDILFPYLFCLYAEHVIRKIGLDLDKGEHW